MMANYVVVARFNDEANEKLINLRKSLYVKGFMKEIFEWEPHITIAAYENVDIHKLLQWTEEFIQKYSAFEIMFSSVGIFPPQGKNTKTAILFASPSPSKALVDFYYAFHKKLDDYCGNIGWWYSAKFVHPVIHSTIGVFEIDKMQKAIEIIYEHQIFELTRIVALEVYTYPMKLIQRFELK